MAEAAKWRREEALNDLEAYLYRMRDLLDNAEESNPFFKCSKPEERSALEREVSQTLSWIHEGVDIATLADFRTKKAALECVS